ncbi:GIY-YIG nuclease family protein [Capilliphycus salinus ALCB114379]|uniref:GIY-YIG nuclease family protein n=1 Tax=Capilliphycus salinus TaxID=2768948 RepID=UPI0039A58B67
MADEHNQILYVGQAKSLRSRWAGRGHHRYKQFSRKGLDKVYLYYIEAPISEINTLEKLYIEQLKPPLNDTRVREYLPKKSPRLSDLQRLLKAANTPWFPSGEFTVKNGIRVPREGEDLIRGFIAGVDKTQDIPHILIICKQNMGSLLFQRVRHRTKKRFCSYDQETVCYLINLRSVIFVFAELFSSEFADPVFQTVYPLRVRICRSHGK